MILCINITVRPASHFFLNQIINVLLFSLKNSWQMKSFRFQIEVNPLWRDLVIVLIMGMLASMAFVTAGYMVLRQF